MVVVGRLDQTEFAGRLSLERLTAGELDPKPARFLWAALEGVVPEKIKDRDTCAVADRLGFDLGLAGQNPCQPGRRVLPVPGDPPALLGSSLLTNFLRIH